MKDLLLLPDKLKFSEDNAELTVKAVLGRRVLIHPVKPHTYMDELEKKGLLYAPERDKEKLTPPPSTGIVLMLGEGFNTMEPEIPGTLTELLKPGSIILFNKFALSSVSVSGQELGILDVTDVMAVLEVATKIGEKD